MSLINCEINIFLTWSEKCIISQVNGALTFEITGVKLHVLVALLST